MSDATDEQIDALLHGIRRAPKGYPVTIRPEVIRALVSEVKRRRGELEDTEKDA